MLLMIEKIFISLQYLIPQHILSRAVGFFANCRWVWLKNLMIAWFIKCYQVDMSIAEKDKISDYATFNEFFIRKLKSSVRPVATAANSIICPVDGILSQWGEVSQGKLIQAKGFDYSLEALLNGSKFTQNFQNGQFITLYLSPKDYHRVHMPVDGELLEMTYVPGRLFAVNFATTNQIPAIFAKNERVLCTFETNLGKMAVILVGAMLVASINTVWAGKITPNKNKAIKSNNYKDIELRSGEEMGHFAMGSTVIVLFEPKRMCWDKLTTNQIVQFGQKIATFD
jgi:phosphatidylserine decarboxylase